MDTSNGEPDVDLWRESLAKLNADLLVQHDEGVRGVVRVVVARPDGRLRPEIDLHRVALPVRHTEAVGGGHQDLEAGAAREHVRAGVYVLQNEEFLVNIISLFTLICMRRNLQFINMFLHSQFSHQIFGRFSLNGVEDGPPGLESLSDEYEHLALGVKVGPERLAVVGVFLAVKGLLSALKKGTKWNSCRSNGEHAKTELP